VLCVAIHSLACLTTTCPPTTHTLPLPAVALYTHLHTDIHLLGPAQPARLYASDAHPTVRARFKEIPTPTCLSTRGETRLRQAARREPAPFLVVSVVPSCLLLAALCKPIAVRLWLEPAVETRTHLRNTTGLTDTTYTATLVAHALRLIYTLAFLDTLVTYTYRYAV